jgi:hypothetical protein
MGRVVKRRTAGPPRYDLFKELEKVMSEHGYKWQDISAAYIILSQMNGNLQLEDGTIIVVREGRICGVGHGRPTTSP